MDLTGMSAHELEQLATKATVLAAMLRKEEPTYELAIEHGVRDLSYRTHSFGWVKKYDGEAVITMADGTKWRAIGHRPVGGADWITREGFIEFIKLEDEAK